jgi:hypothetical protein
MTGILQVKNGKYYIVLSYYENGKRQRRWIATGLPEKNNKRKAGRFLRSIPFRLRESLPGGTGVSARLAGPAGRMRAGASFAPLLLTSQPVRSTAPSRISLRGLLLRTGLFRKERHRAGFLSARCHSSKR